MSQKVVTLEVSINVSGDFFCHGLAIAEMIKAMRGLCVQYPATARVVNITLKSVREVNNDPTDVVF